MSARQDAADARLPMLLALRLGGVDHVDAVSVLNEYDAIQRIAVLAEAVALVSLHVDLDAPPQRILTELRRMADTPRP